MEKTPLIVANWKMYPADADNAKALFSSINAFVRKEKLKGTIVIVPPAMYLGLFSKQLKKDSRIALGVQDVSVFQNEGAHTGEISATMIKNIGVSYAIIGHSERRASGETDEMVSKKLAGALDAGLVAILCVGEKERDEQGLYLAALKTQIEHSLKEVPLQLFKRLVIAYEPVFAIGKDASHALAARDIHETVIFIRKVINDWSLAQNKKTNVQTIPVLYGGSVAPINAGTIYTEGSVNGFLVGHQSLDLSAFKEIIRSTSSRKRA